MALSEQDIDEAHLLAMLDNPHDAHAIAALTDDEVNDAADEVDGGADDDGELEDDEADDGDVDDADATDLFDTDPEADPSDDEGDSK